MNSDPEDPSETAKRRDEAAAWFVRLREPGASDADRRAFRQWLAEDPNRHDDFNDVKRLWNKLETPAAILGEDAWYREGLRRPASTWARYGMAAAAAAVCVVIVSGATLWREPGLLDRAFADYSTRPGERRDIVLSDGTHAELDGDTAITVKIGPEGRVIGLLRGRAWFDVVHDAQAPFVVRAGDAETRDIGTAFAVDRDGEGVEVSVAQGLVAVSRPDSDSVKVPAGEQVTIADGRIGVAVRIDPETAFAWRRGLIVLDHAPLERVVEELGRMQPGRIIIPDSELRQLRLTGVFRADDPAAIIEAFHSALGLKTVSIPGFATLVYR